MYTVDIVIYTTNGGFKIELIEKFSTYKSKLSAQL